MVHMHANDYQYMAVIVVRTIDVINPVKRSGNYKYLLVQQSDTSVKCALCIYLFRVIHYVTSDCFLKQQQPTDLCNGEL
jgi:hypothetical protein